ncbi:site-specific DNA-methyltransferase [[Clostridium] innocuum]|nr:site-specific DNA-methyltransferase [[Clostridium] innocuum]
MGSGSTCIAAQNTNRKYIGIELDDSIFNIAKERLKRNRTQLQLF